MTRSAATNATSASLAYSRIVEEVTDSGVTQTELGSVVGVALRTVQNWASGDTIPAGLKARRLLDLQYIVRELRTAYTDEGVQIWLHSRNRNLDRKRPIDMLAAGELDQVLTEAERVAGAM
jgi:transcriptional regulator with XRE-family HTH domain